ncbi:MAG: molybdenum cofactor biosynthesis protein MoaE, partial [Candidatus Omnitrophica bacterium]|nr:molybdenum cofactor biosynthesis protein MoaE [Candidatus Omnitrophota bacterium]
YIAEREACLKEGTLILQEAMKNFPIQNALCIQRIGHVLVGESATWIGAWSIHRDEAFKASRYIIEETKKRLLIWKKEFYSNGQSQWIRGTETPVIL